MQRDAYLVGLTDADLFTPAEHELTVPNGGRPIITIRDIGRALGAAGLPRTLSNIRDYLRGFGDHGAFLVAASKMGAVDYATGGVQ